MRTLNGSARCRGINHHCLCVGGEPSAQTSLSSKEFGLKIRFVPRRFIQIPLNPQLILLKRIESTFLRIDGKFPFGASGKCDDVVGAIKKLYSVWLVLRFANDVSVFHCIDECLICKNFRLLSRQIFFLIWNSLRNSISVSNENFIAFKCLMSQPIHDSFITRHRQARLDNEWRWCVVIGAIAFMQLSICARYKFN